MTIWQKLHDHQADLITQEELEAFEQRSKERVTYEQAYQEVRPFGLVTAEDDDQLSFWRGTFVATLIVSPVWMVLGYLVIKWWL